MSKNNESKKDGLVTDKAVIIKYCVIIMGILSVGMVLYYIVFISKGYYHADCTDTITWAEAIIDGKALMNKDFYYACLLPFGGQLLMLPFVAVFGVGMTAQLCGMVMFAVCFAAAIVFMLKSMDMGYKGCVAGVSSMFMILSISEKLREIFWCHIIYYSLGLIFLMVGMGLAIRVLKSDKRKYVFLLTVWTILCSMNGIQSLTIYGMPVLAALVANIFFDVKTPVLSKKNEKKYIIISILVFSILIGILLGKIVNGNIIAGYQNGYSTFSNQDEWLDNFLSIVPQWFKLFGIEADDGIMLYSSEGIIILLKAVCSLIILGVPVVMMFMYKRFEATAYRLMILTHGFMTGLILSGWIFGSLNTACWRLSPIIGTSVILCVMFARWIYANKIGKRISAVIIVPLAVLILISAMDIVKINNTQSVSNKNLEELISVLDENNLHYGYGTFWNANSITLLSDNDIKVRCIAVDDEGARPRMYQTNINWYKGDLYEEYFILLGSEEYFKYRYSSGYAEPVKEIKHDDYYILVYDYNILEIK